MDTATLSVGDRLRNGARIISIKQTNARHEDGTPAQGVVLAMREGIDYEPYVTWAINLDDGSTYWGHYYQDIEGAAIDYNKRG